AQNIIWKNLLTKFHEDWTINVASCEKYPDPGGRVYKATKIIFELIQDIIRTNLLTNFHDDRKINVTSRVLTRKNAPPPFMKIGLNEKCPAPCSHVFQANVTIFEQLLQDINKTNLLTIFHEEWTKNVASRVSTRKNAQPPGGHVFKETKIIFKLIQDIIGTNLLSKFREDRKINVASRVLTRKNAPPPGGHVFQSKGIIFELVQEIFGMNLLTKKKAPPLGSYELIQDIVGTNHLSKFHEDWIINVASRVLTRKNAPPPDGHVFKQTSIIFELVQDIIRINRLTNFHEDLAINVVSRVKMPRPIGSHVFQSNVTIFKLIQDIIKTNLLTKLH
ncbi:hypothetical protein DPMN_172959, partial [Dreissena polymorpha]